MKFFVASIITISIIFSACGPTEREQAQREQREAELLEQQQESDIPYNFRLQMETLLDHYFELKNAVAEAEPETASEKATALSAWTYEVKDDLLRASDQGLWNGISRILRNEAQNLAGESSTEEQLIFFSRISNSVIQVADSFDPVNGTLYRMECDQISGYSAVWLSRKEEGTNPYAIQSSEDCADVVDQI